MNLENVRILEETLDSCRNGGYMVGGTQVGLKLTRQEMSEVKVFLPDEVEALRQCSVQPDVNHCRITCENIDSFSMALNRLHEYPDRKILILNFANPVHPGGGVLRGTTAQEEDLCRKSSLFLSLQSEQALRYYEYNRSLNTFMGSDAIIITPNVEIIRDRYGNLMENTAVVSVMTCAAPKISYGLEGMSEAQYRDMLCHRISGLLYCAAAMGYRHLVLGAFGCGAFGNDARVVSDLFREAMQEFDCGGLTLDQVFRQIDFAVLSRHPYNFDEFNRNFGEKQSGGMEYIQPEDGPVFFWKLGEHGEYFSNWYSSPFVVDDFCYLHAEQYLMAQKAKLFHDSVRYTAILRADTPEQCKQLGRMVTPYDDSLWAAKRYEVLKRGLRAKFTQNADLKEKLLATGQRILAEASPRDRIWGIGLSERNARQTAQWPGQNLLGKALMEIREELAENGR